MATSQQRITALAQAVAADIKALATATQSHAATSKITPVDADELPLIDSEAGYGLKKLSWANLKATLQTYFDTLYQPVDVQLSSLIRQNVQNVNYTFALTDVGKHVLHPSTDATARTFTIPANASVAFQVGSAITVVNQTNAGTVTIAITSGTLTSMGSAATGSRTLPAGNIATLLKISATAWVITGSSGLV